MPDRNQSFDALFLRSRDSSGRDRIVSMLTAEEGFSMPSSSEEPQFTRPRRRLSCSVGTHLLPIHKAL